MVMKKVLLPKAQQFLLLLFFGIIFTHSSLAQVTFTSVQNGAWNNGATWGNTSPGVAGVDYPSAIDDAIITGGVNITINPSQQCRNLLIDVTAVNTISIGFLPSISLTVNGTMVAWDNTSGGISIPTTFSSAINPLGIGGNLIFTGQSVTGLESQGIANNEIIAFWNNVNTINVNVIINNTTGTPKLIDFLFDPSFANTSIDFDKNVTVSNGTLQTGSNAITGFNVAGSLLSVSSGATLSLNVPITSDGVNPITQISNSGTVTTTSFINANTFTINSGAIFNTAYNGIEGWWSGANRPTSFNINDASRINYNSNGDQTVYPRQYGNLWMSNGGTKTLYYNASTANAPLEINGNFNIASGPVTFNCNANPNSISIRGNLSNSGTWAPNKVIVFDGTGTQTITGTGTSFGSGITIGDGANANDVEISSPLATTNLIINTSATFDSQNNNLTISGNWSNSGTFTAGTSLVTFNGTSTITGITAFNDVSITGTLNVSAAGNTFNDVTISPTATLTTTNSISVNDLVNNGTINSLTKTISLSGSFTNNGTYNRGTGTLVFNGTGVQNLTGSSITNVHNLTISNTNPAADVVNINSNVNLYNILTLNSNGWIDADGSSNSGVLTLISQDNGTAKIGPIGSGAVLDGNITMQRKIYPNVGAKGWRFVSTPIKKQTLADWSDDFNIQGVTGGPLPGASPITFTYNETLATDPFGINGWDPITAITDNISTQGIRVFFFDSQLPSLILDNTGPPVVGDGFNSTVIGNEKFTTNVSFTSTGFEGGGWNLVHNPYPCEINFDHVISTDAGKAAGLVNVNNGVYIWDPTIGVSGNYRSYVSGVGTNGGSQYIASGQSFFVKANAIGASISYIENDKVTDQGNTFIREGAVENVLVVKIKSADKSNFDETAIRFKEGSSDAFEKEFDAFKLPFGVINISTIPTPDLDLSINTLDEVATAKSVKFRISAYANGSYTISFDGFDSFSKTLGYRLVDKYTGTSVIVNSVTEYSFTIDSAIPATSGDDRFELQLTTPVSLSFEEVSNVQAGQEFVLPVLADMFTNIYGSSITINWDNTALELVGVEELSYMAEGDFDLSNTADGILTLDYSALTPITLADGSKLFAIRFMALEGVPQTEVTFGDLELTGPDDIELAYEAENIFICIKQKVNVLGSIATDGGETIKGVQVSMANDDGSFKTLTDENGDYIFDAYQGDTFTLSASEGEGLRLQKGLTIFDVVLTKLHILNIRPFDSPYKYIAADVNNSKSVTVLDAFEMLKVLLGRQKEFSSGLNWQFIPGEMDLSNDPFSYETSLDIAIGDMDESVDFIGVKLGDVNNSWVSTYANRLSNKDLKLSLENISLNGEYVEIPVVASELLDIMGYQFSITWDPNELQFSDIESGVLEGIFNEEYAASGVLTTVWSEGNAMQLAKGSTLFTLRLKTINKNANSLVEVKSNPTEAMAVDADLNMMSIKAIPAMVDLNNLRDGSLALFQNVPNPFDHNTQISFRIADEGTARLTVINTLGEIVYNHENKYKAGVYSITWDKNQSLRSITPGMYLYRLESNGEEVVKKMIIK